MQNICKTLFECFYDYGRVIGWLVAGLSVTTIATAIGVSKSVISLVKKNADGGNAMQKHADGCRRIITSPENQCVSLVAKRNRNATPRQIAADIAIATGMHVSARVI